MPTESSRSPQTMPLLAQAKQTGVRSPVRISASQLFQDRQEILIEHKGETYQLRVTRNDKLILTK